VVVANEVVEDVKHKEKFPIRKHTFSQM